MQPKENGRLTELDGLRGLAIVAVVVAHYFGEVPHGVPVLTAGWLGVELFFVLSGFLIGGILLDNRGSERFFSTFYIRRAFRIVPIYYLVLVAVFVSSGLLRASHAAWLPASLPPAAYFSYTQNIAMALSGKVDGFWLLPTWTLAVEEQFYLLLPLLIYLLPKRHMLAVIAFAIVSAPVLRALVFLTNHADPVTLTSLLPCRWDALFLGVLAAYVYRERQLFDRIVQRNVLQWFALAGSWGVLLCAVIERFSAFKIFDVLGLSFAAVCFGALLLMTVSGPAMRRRFQAPWLCWFGRISYGLYLIHQPILGLTHGLLRNAAPEVGSATAFAVTLLALSLSIGIAWLSWTFFESRLVRYGHRWTYARGHTVEFAPAEAV